MKSPFSQRNALIGLALAATSLAGGLAHAERAPSQFKTVGVRYSNLDLANPDGAQALYQRIKIAARHACGREVVEDLTLFAHYRECYDNAVANAVATVQSNRVTELHHAESQSNERAIPRRRG